MVKKEKILFPVMAKKITLPKLTEIIADEIRAAPIGGELVEQKAPITNGTGATSKRKKTMTTTKKPVKIESDPIAFEAIKADQIYIYDDSTGEKPKDMEDEEVFLGSIEIMNSGDTYPLYNLHGSFSEDNLKKILSIGNAYTKTYKEAQDNLAKSLPVPTWNKKGNK